MIDVMPCRTILINCLDLFYISPWRHCPHLVGVIFPCLMRAIGFIVSLPCVLYGPILFRICCAPLAIQFQFAPWMRSFKAHLRFTPKACLAYRSCASKSQNYDFCSASALPNSLHCEFHNLSVSLSDHKTRHAHRLGRHNAGRRQVQITARRSHAAVHHKRRAIRLDDAKPRSGAGCVSTCVLRD